MTAYLISYDLDEPGQDYTDLWAALKQMGAKRVLYSEWIVNSAAGAVALRDYLLRFIDANDRLLVVGLSGEAAWNRLMSTNEAFKQVVAA